MIAGSMVALVTPMDAQGRLDWGSLDKLVDFHLENGTHAIVAVGTTGESATLDVEEHILVIKHVVERVKHSGRFRSSPVPVPTPPPKPSPDPERQERRRRRLPAGVPYYNKPTQEGLYQHFKHIAEAVDIPQILYNVPGRTSCDMQAETVIRLSTVPNIIGIKEATGDLVRAKAILDGVSKDFIVLSGDDPTAVELILMGGKGNISVTANVAPREMADLCEAALEGNAEKARAINEKLMPLHKDLFCEANPIPVKWALVEMGLMHKGIRLPLTWLSEGCHEKVRTALRQSGVLV
jgi:4-hydroxy-tetrahydrodipicolinate synthase